MTNILTPAASEQIYYSSGVSWKAGATDLTFDGLSGYVSIPGGMYLRLYQDFTIEISVFPTNIAKLQIVAGRFTPASGGFWAWRIELTADGIFRFDAGSSPMARGLDNVVGKDIANAVSMGAAVPNAWNQLAVCRQGDTYRTFNNGVLISIWTSTLAPYFDPLVWPALVTNATLLGARVPEFNDRFFIGRLTEFRVSHIARYAPPNLTTIGYTPATSPFVWDEDTALLMHFDAPVPVLSSPYQLAIRRIESLAVLARVLDAIAASFLGETGAIAYPLHEAIGDVRAHGGTYIQTKTLSAPLLLCFQSALGAGVTFDQLETILTSFQAEAPISLDAVAIVQLSERFCLATMARRLAATVFVSRDEADDALDRILLAFDPAIEQAVDEHDAGNYQALLALQGAVTRDLVARSLLLPNRINFEFFDTMPTLWIAQRVYQDGARADEIAKENHIVHPLFCPRDLQMLSS